MCRPGRWASTKKADLPLPCRRGREFYQRPISIKPFACATFSSLPVLATGILRDKSQSAAVAMIFIRGLAPGELESRLRHSHASEPVELINELPAGRAKCITHLLT